MAMGTDQSLQAIYLVVLLAAVVGTLFFGNRQSLGKTVQQIAIWAMIFLGVIAAYGLWGDLRRQIVPGAARVTASEVDIPASEDGHFYVKVAINGTPILFVIDTGASGIALTRADAAKAGIDTGALVYTGQSQTANGVVPTASVRLDTVELGEFRDQRVPASVIGGDLDVSLLGMAYLTRYEVTFTRDRIVLKR